MTTCSMPSGKIRRIYLDMDGVLADWMVAVCRLYGRTWQDVMKVWAPGQGHSIHKPLNITAEELEHAIDHVDDSFWLDIPIFPWARSLYHICRDIAPTCIVTKPPRGFKTAHLKAAWLRQLFGPEFNDFFLGSEKHFFAAPGHVLVDDSEQNCALFREHGGKAVLFPQYLNSNHMLRQRAPQYAVDRLLQLDSRPPRRLE